MKTFLKITGIFLIWRLFLFLIGAVADSFLIYDPSFPYADSILISSDLPRWLYSWAGFDGVHYLTILKEGYLTTGLIQAFFPLYPLTGRLLTLITDNALISNLLLSNISFIGLLYFWYKFVLSEYSKKIAKYSTLALLLFPTSLFFGATYTESLFLLFVIATFWFVNKKNYWLVALFIFLASATRVTGILLLPAVIFEILFSNIKWGDSFNKIKKDLTQKIKSWKKYIKPILIVSLGAFGLFAYMAYLCKEFGDGLYFFHVQSEFGGGVRQETLISYPQVLYRYIKILLTARPFDLKYFSYAQDLVASTLGLGVIIYSLKKVKLSYVIFSLLAFIVPTLTGTFSSMPRYILVCFPLFILLGDWSSKSKLFRIIWFSISSLLLIVNTVLFIQGYWVA